MHEPTSTREQQNGAAGAWNWLLLQMLSLDKMHRPLSSCTPFLHVTGNSSATSSPQEAPETTTRTPAPAYSNPDTQVQHRHAQRAKARTHIVGTRQNRAKTLSDRLVPKTPKVDPQKPLTQVPSQETKPAVPSPALAPRGGAGNAGGLVRSHGLVRNPACEKLGKQVQENYKEKDQNK